MDKVFSERMGLIIGLSVGVVGAIAIVVTVVVVIVCCKRKCRPSCLEKGKSQSKSKQKENYMYVPADHDITKTPAEKDEGMVDNVLYEPMGQAGQMEMRKTTGSTVYADVNVEGGSGQNGNHIRQTSPAVVYSEVRISSEGPYSEVQSDPEPTYSNVAVKPNPEAAYSVVNKTSKGPPLPPKL